MLTKTKSSRSRALKYLMAFPLSFVLFMLCTQTSFSGETGVKGNKAYFKGNEIVFGGLKIVPMGYRETFEQQKEMFMFPSLPDSVPVNEWQTGHVKMQKVAIDTMPVSINGKPIMGNEPQYATADRSYTPPVLNSSARSFEEYLFSKLENELNKLDNGDYVFHINRLVIDEQGNIAYFENEGVQPFWGPDNKMPLIRDDMKQTLSKQLAQVLSEPLKFRPAIKNNKPVNVRMSLNNFFITVQDHKARLTERQGC